MRSERTFKLPPAARAILLAVLVLASAFSPVAVPAQQTAQKKADGDQEQKQAQASDAKPKRTSGVVIKPRRPVQAQPAKPAATYEAATADGGQPGASSVASAGTDGGDRKDDAA